MSQNRKSVCEVVSVLCYAMPPVPQYQCSPLVRSPISVLSSVRRMDEHNSSSVAHIMRPALLARVGVAGLAALGALVLASLIHRKLKVVAPQPGETVLLAPSAWRRVAPAYISARDATVDLNRFFDGFKDEGPAMIAAVSHHNARRTNGHAPKARTVNSPGYHSRAASVVDVHDGTMSLGRGRGIRRRLQRLERKQEQFQQEELQMAERMQKLLQKLIALDTTHTRNRTPGFPGGKPRTRRAMQLNAHVTRDAADNSAASASHTSSLHASSHTSSHTFSHTDHARAFTGNTIHDAAIVRNHDASPHESKECIPPKAVVHGKCINSPEHEKPPAHCTKDPHSVACQSWHKEHQARIAAYHSAIQHSGYDPYSNIEHGGQDSGHGIGHGRPCP